VSTTFTGELHRVEVRVGTRPKQSLSFISATATLDKLIVVKVIAKEEGMSGNLHHLKSVQIKTVVTM